MLNLSLNEEAIFKVACRITADDARAEYLQQVCGSDPELRCRVERLLLAYFQQPTFLESSSTNRDFDGDFSLSRERVGSILGPYKILEKIAEGGMGVVYVAEQSEPIRRKVALKVIRPGMAGKNVVARFEAERQALAMMNHPNIARVFDGGATDEQLPYFVMELVQGLPITEYCDQQRLTIRERLELFLDVCHAVQHAHQKGIIHRDLKPSNVLVAEIDAKAVAKVIDFGVAKAIHQPLTERSIHTQFSQMIGTPLYMSPEQAGLGVIDVDTRSDVYSLGVMLYEMLTGDTPFSRQTLETATFDEMRRIIREQEPRRPSAMISTMEAKAQSTIAEQRRIDPRKLRDSLHGELDWIVMKALAKDRERRYGSASELSDDIERFLNDEPVSACPPSTLYSMRRFARRHRAVISTVFVCLVALVAGIVATSWQMFRAMNAEKTAVSASERADSEAAVANAINHFLTEDLLSQVDHEVNVTPNPDVRLREILDRAAARIGTRFQSQPLVRASVQLTLSSVYESLGEYQLALGLAQQSHETRQRELGTDALDTLKSKHGVAWIIYRQDRLVEAEQMLREVHELRCDALGKHDAATLGTLSDIGVVVASLGRFDEAEKIQRGLLDALQHAPGPPDEDSIAASLVRIGLTFNWCGRYAEAIESYHSALAIYERIDKPSGEAMALGNLASVYLRQRDFANAEKLLNRSLQMKTKTLGKMHPWTIADLSNLGVLCGMQGRHDEAEKAFREALDVCRRTLGNDNQQTLNSIKNLCISLCALERFEEAIPLAKERLDILRRIRGIEDPQAISAIDNLFAILRSQGKTDEAFTWQREQLELTRGTFGNEKKETIDRITNLAAELASSQQYGEAEDLFREALDLRRSVLGADDLSTLVAAKNLEVLYLIRAQELATDPEPQTRDTSAAVDLARKAIELRSVTAEHSDELAEYWQKMGAGELQFRSPADPLNVLGVALYRDTQGQEAIRILEESIAIADESGYRHGFYIAMAYSQIGDHTKGQQWYDRSLAWMNEHASSDDEVKELQTEAARTLGIAVQLDDLSARRKAQSDQQGIRADQPPTQPERSSEPVLEAAGADPS